MQGVLMMSQALGTYLETMRKLNGVSPREVAAVAGTYPNILIRLINGDTQRPGLEMIRKLTKAVRGRWLDVWWVQETGADVATARLLAEARYAVETGGILTPEQRAVMARLLADPEVASAVVAHLGAQLPKP